MPLGGDCCCGCIYISTPTDSTSLSASYSADSGTWTMPGGVLTLAAGGGVLTGTVNPPSVSHGAKATVVFQDGMTAKLYCTASDAAYLQVSLSSGTFTATLVGAASRSWSWSGSPGDSVAMEVYSLDRCSGVLVGLVPFGLGGFPGTVVAQATNASGKIKLDISGNTADVVVSQLEGVRDADGCLPTGDLPQVNTITEADVSGLPGADDSHPTDLSTCNGTLGMSTGATPNIVTGGTTGLGFGCDCFSGLTLTTSYDLDACANKLTIAYTITAFGPSTPVNFVHTLTSPGAPDPGAFSGATDSQAFSADCGTLLGMCCWNGGTATIAIA